MAKKKRASLVPPLPQTPPHPREARADSEFYRSFLDRSSDAVMLHDTEGHFLDVNETFCQRLGYRREELLAMTPLDINIQSETASVFEQLDILHRQGQSCAETFLVHRDGRLIRTRIRRKVITLHGHQVILTIARYDACDDDSSPVDTRQILSMTNDLIAFLDRDLVYRQVNRAYCRALGRKAEQIIGTSARVLHGAGTFDHRIKPHLEEALAGRIVRDQSWADYPALGRRLMDVTYYPFCEHGSDTISGVVLFSHDITDMHAPKHKKKTRERQWPEWLLNSMPIGVYIIDHRFNLQYVNPIIQERFGPLQADRKKCHQYLIARSTPCPWCRAGRIFAGSSACRWNWQDNDPDGDITTTYDVHAAPVSDGSTPPSILIFLFDITDKQNIVSRMQLLNDQLTTLVNALPDGIFCKDGAGRWLLANRVGLQLFGLDEIEYFGKTDHELARLSPFYREALLTSEQSDELTWEKGKVCRYETVLPLADGNTRNHEVIKTPLFHEDGSRKALIVLSRDITKWVETEKALRSEMEKRKEANISMRVLLDQYREARQEVEQQITAQLKKLVFPYLEYLAQSPGQEEARECLEIISSHLSSITDPFAKKLSDPILGLTPREILVADLVRKGKSTQTIAQTLNLSKRTIDAYRISLRRKLRLTNKKVNLREYLRSVYSLND